MNGPVDSEEVGRRIRSLRAERRLTLKQLEVASGLSATHLSEIERGRTSPTVGALVRIARALGRDASFFVETEELADVAHLPRERVTSRPGPGGALVGLLSAGIPGCHLFPYRVTLGGEAPGDLVLDAQEQPGEAVYLVRRGRVEAVFGETRLELSAGDAAQAPLDCAHRLRCGGAEGAELVAILTRRLDVEV